VAIVGGGFIGLEIAAVARRLGKDVLVLEAADRLMSRAVTPLVSDFFADLHRQHGVHLELNAPLAGIIGTGTSAVAVRSADGREFACELVVAGIGIVPNCEIAQAAGLECEQGIVVDACSRTSDAAIVAAGDCTARRLPDGRLQRLESVHNAIEQARSAAAALLGKDRPFLANPAFWSDQYDIKLQMVGVSPGYDAVVERGDRAAQKFSAFYYRAAKLVAVDSVNRPVEFAQARKLLDAARTPAPEQLADPDFDLGTLLP
jgi:3-phenylpropionate/trans-cinnamate dioxygenase ferredoxin reductase subunit